MFGFANFWRQHIGEKVEHKMLMQLTSGWPSPQIYKHPNRKNHTSSLSFISDTFFC